ncbi:GDSL-type esterase/lipase family protein [Acidovorax sp. A1169]|uniref:GDSL-type esterase/lipase family protein n=1 Tax=Acidovorax sp. A1169 TaxID=3059524 RepID=UPI002737EF7C|nr:GDSL-type esterase/lipase family protein [Acidovorax sp. A1169]MDP4077199.1 GDSL-type esterase/lipase family protein [Acidovorax sp. A1169]
MLAAGLLAASIAPLAACGRKPSRGQTVPSGATVLALGDSLTSGVGASADTAYPAVLQRLTGWKVINGGISGDTSTQALQRLPDLLQKHQPALVIVSIGGNDFLRRQSASATHANVRKICEQARAAGAQVLLVAVPEFTVMATLGQLSDHAMYQEIASELKVPLHRKGWSGVLADAKLRSDQIHANAAGYELFTQGLVDTLKETGLLAR